MTQGLEFEYCFKLNEVLDWKEKEEDPQFHYRVGFIHSSIHSFVRSFARSSLVHSFIHSFIHSFVRSFVRSFVCTLACLFIHSFIHSFIYSFIHSHSFIHSFILFIEIFKSFFITVWQLYAKGTQFGENGVNDFLSSIFVRFRNITLTSYSLTLSLAARSLARPYVHSFIHSFRYLNSFSLQFDSYTQREHKSEKWHKRLSFKYFSWGFVTLTSYSLTGSNISVKL